TVRSVAVRPNLTRVAVAAEDFASTKGPTPHVLGLYSLTSGDTSKLTELAAVPGSHLGAIASTQFSPDGTILATGSKNSSVGLWDVTKAGKDWKPYETIAAGQWTVLCLAFSPDGRTLVAGTSDRMRANLYLIDVRGRKLVASHRLESTLTAV